MAAIVSGNALGMGLGSFATLGQRGVWGQAAQGRSGEQVFVNAATGNLVLQTRDEYLAAIGQDLVSVRTYNSQGLLNDDTGLPRGLRSLRASYGGDAQNLSGVSGPLALELAPTQQSSQVTVHGGPASLVVQVQGSSSKTPAGIVTFTEASNGAVLGTAALGVLAKSLLQQPQ